MKNEESKKIIDLWKESMVSAMPAETPNLKVVDQLATYFSSGSFFYYIFDFSQFQMKYVHSTIMDQLGIPPEEFGADKFLELVHPDDLPILRKKEECSLYFLQEYLKPEDITRYKVSYTMRMRRSDGSYYLNLHQSTTLNLSEEDKIAHVVGTETNIEHLSQQPDSTISFIDLLGTSSYLNLDINNFRIEKNLSQKTALSSKELDVLRMISFGYDNRGIANSLNISPNTVRTHRQNIIKKETGRNMVEVISDHIRRGII
ncbi:MAG: LuxR C-terminal-related transcriptional regulator [Cyclobacteriaceae bacterium]